MKFNEIPKFVVNLETRPDNLELIKKKWIISVGSLKSSTR